LARERKLPRNSNAITPRSGEISGLAAKSGQLTLNADGMAAAFFAEKT
jgi:hypothetical protein